MTSLDELLPVVGDATVTLVRPGDTLAVQLDGHLSEAEIDRIREQLEVALPEGMKVIFFDCDVKFGILRPEQPE